MNYKKNLLISFTIYLILFIILFPKFQYVINTDAVSYFSIAKKYFNGHFSEALNGYFGPLYSWLILPAFIFKVEPVVFARVINVIFSFMMFILVNRYLIVLKVEPKTFFITIYYFIIPLLLFSFWYITPDYLLLILSMSLILLSLSEDYLLNIRTATLSAMLATLLFLTKSFGLVFFLLFQTIVVFILLRNNQYQKKKILFNYLLSIVFFFILISPWIYLISNKYGEFTISTSGKINLLIVNPELNFRHPSIESGIVPPSDKYAVSAWDDPDLKSYPQWSPFNSLDDMKYFLSNFLKNILKFFGMLLLFCPIFFLAIIKVNKSIVKRKDFLIILSALLLNGIIYSFVYVESRYIWLSLVLFSILTFLMLQGFFDKINLNKLSGKLVIIVIWLSTLIFVYFAKNSLLIDTRGYNYSQKISQIYNLKGNIATTNHWWLGLYISYFLDSKFYGEEKNSILDEKLISKFKNAGINYIFDYSDDIKSLEGLKFLTKIDSLSIYRVLYSD